MALVSEVLNNVRLLTTDPLGTRWSDAELIGWLNDAMRQAVATKPDANPVTEEFTCVAGTKQDLTTLAQDLISLIEVVSNTATGGGTERPVTFIKRSVLDAERPLWRSDTSSLTIRHYMYEERQRDFFYVYPPATVSATLEVIYGAVPAAVTATGDTLPMQDVYVPALVNYVVWRAQSKDSDFSGDMNLASGYYGAFMQALVGKIATELKEENPQRYVPPARVLGTE